MALLTDSRGRKSDSKAGILSQSLSDIGSTQGDYFLILVLNARAFEADGVWVCRFQKTAKIRLFEGGGWQSCVRDAI